MIVILMINRDTLEVVKKIAAGVLIGLLFFVIVVVVRGPEVRTSGRQDQQVTQSSGPCPSPFVFRLPVGMENVTSILYPGQLRGGEYKAHGVSV